MLIKYILTNLFIYFSEDWMLSSFLPGQDDLSRQLQDLSSSLFLLPLVSVASCLSNDQNSGSVFCCLPLPHGSQDALTGLPVHVNASFGLNDNRRALKWPADDQKHDKSAL